MVYLREKSILLKGYCNIILNSWETEIGYTWSSSFTVSFLESCHEKNILGKLFKIYRHSMRCWHNSQVAQLYRRQTVKQIALVTAWQCAVCTIDQHDVYQFTYKCNPFHFTSIPKHLRDPRLGTLCSNSSQAYLINWRTFYNWNY